MPEPSERPEVAEHLDLEPHPEGGWFRQTFKAAEQIRRADGTTRSAATLINFFLPAGAASAWHLVSSTEIWIWQGPGRRRCDSVRTSPPAIFRR